MHRTLLRVIAVATFTTLGAGPLHAAGLWNMPTTFRQCLGYGYGPGYHAPMVLESAWRGTAASPGVKRVRPMFDMPHYYPSREVPQRHILAAMPRPVYAYGPQPVVGVPHTAPNHPHFAAPGLPPSKTLYQAPVFPQ